MKPHLLTLVAAAAVTALVASEASAQTFRSGVSAGRGFKSSGFGARGRGFGGFGGFGGFQNNIRLGPSNIYDLYLNGLSPIPPYFALNPPVYYSYPVPRTYGYSPFAYPGYVKTPDIIEDPVPLEIMNPYVPSSTIKKNEQPPADTTVEAKSEKAAAQRVEPLVIDNPYFDAEPDIYTVSH